MRMNWRLAVREETKTSVKCVRSKRVEAHPYFYLKGSLKRRIRRPGWAGSPAKDKGQGCTRRDERVAESCCPCNEIPGRRAARAAIKPHIAAESAAKGGEGRQVW